MTTSNFSPRPPRVVFWLVFALALTSSVEVRAAVPVWPKVTPADVTAAGIDVQLTGCDYGNGTFVLATYFGGSLAVPAVTPAVFTSPDGTTWTRRTLPVSGRTGAPRFLNGKFLLGVTPDSVSGGNGVILSSTDGITWAASANLGSTINAPSEFAFGNGVYAAPVYSYPASAQVMTSPDGVIWTNRVVDAGASSSHVTFFNGKLYLSTYNYSDVTHHGRLYSSADGVTWTNIPTAPSGPGVLAAGSTTLLTTTDNSGVAGQAVSADGATFTTASPGFELKTETIKYLNGAFVVPDSPVLGNYDLTIARASYDGRTWTTIGSVANQYGAPEIAYGNGVYVFVGEFNVFAGTTTILPGGGSGSDTAPAFTTQPASQTVTVGANVVLVAAASGSPTPTYQWKKGTNNISGATGATLTLNNVQTADAGTYTVVATNTAGSVTSNGAVLTVNAATSTSYLANLSVRAAMGAGQTLIVGFVVDGGAKPILVRAAGPTLNHYGLTGVVDPRLSLYNGSTVVTSNDDWNSSLASTFTTLGAFAFDAASKDAALQQSIDGPRTAQATATGAGTILVEAYDAGANNGPKLVNLSTRFQVGTGDNILIAGFVLSGTGTRQLLVRAVGPTLASYGVTGTLVDPQLAVYDGSTVLASNDNWSSSLTPTFDTVGAFHLLDASKDAAIVVTLQAGKAYTAQVSGVGNTTGEALIEIYLIP